MDGQDLKAFLDSEPQTVQNALRSTLELGKQVYSVEFKKQNN
jgi:hypothetical protein